MTTLVAKGYTADDKPVYLWNKGSYEYEIQTLVEGKSYRSSIEAFECDFETAVLAFEERVVESTPIDWPGGSLTHH